MNKLKIKEEIKELFDQKSDLYESEENQRRLAMWGKEICPDEYLPGELSPIPAHNRKEKRVPITADWDRIQKSKLLNFDISTYYQEPLIYLKWTLRIDIHRFKNFPDDTPLLKTIPIFLSVAFEPNLFGVPIIYSTEHEPLFTSEGAILESKSDLAKLEILDFYKSGIMPLAHKFYEEIKKLAPNDYYVLFPKWCRAPLGVACAMRGMEKLLIDMIEDPPFVHQLMRLITDSRKEYTNKSREFTGEDEVESTLLNDEVTSTLISPKFYEEFCLPYENELAEFYGSIRWWHSCGAKTAFIPLIKKISKPIKLIDLNWWCEDVKKGIRELNGEIPYHIRPNAYLITNKNEDIIRNNINAILCMCNNDTYMFRIDGYQPQNPTEDDVQIMQKFMLILKRASEEEVESTKG